MATNAERFVAQRPNDWVLHEYELDKMKQAFNKQNGAKEGDEISLPVLRQFLRMERTGINVYRDVMAKIGVEVKE